MSSSSDVTPGELLDKFNRAFLDICKYLTCQYCDKIFNNPISLRCAHRFCEICVVKSEKPGATSCPKCQKSSLSERLPQYQLKMYCSKLEPFLRDHQNTYPQNDTSSQFMKFIKADTTLSKLNEQFFEDTENVPPKVEEPENDFISNRTSVSVVARGSPGGLFINDTLNAIREETPANDSSAHELYAIREEMEEQVDEDGISEVPESQPEPRAPQESNVEPNSENDLSDLDIDSNNLPNEYRDHSSENVLTQEEFKVQKSMVNYVHKTKDKFDRIVGGGEGTMKTESETTRSSYEQIPDEWNGSSQLMDDLFDSEMDMYFDDLVQ